MRSFPWLPGVFDGDTGGGMVAVGGPTGGISWQRDVVIHLLIFRELSEVFSMCLI